MKHPDQKKHNLKQWRGIWTWQYLLYYHKTIQDMQLLEIRLENIWTSNFIYDIQILNFQTKGHLLKNLKEAGVKRRKVLTLHTDLTIQGGWTLTPLMPELIKVLFEMVSGFLLFKRLQTNLNLYLHKVTHPSTEWYFFLDEAAVVNVTILQSIIGKLDPFLIFFHRSRFTRCQTVRNV